jgi:hypothetical protein
MRKSVTLGVCLLFLLALVAQPASSQTSKEAKDLLTKWIDAQGGAKALAAIKDTTVTGTIEMITMGMSGSVTMYQKEPNLMRLDIEVMGMVITQGYDGKTAWMTNPQSGVAEELPENFAQELKRQALGNDALLNPEKYGITYAYKGKESVEGKEYLVLEQATSDGHKTSFYLDPATYLPHQTKGTALNQTGMEVEAVTVFGDYKKFENVVMAFSLTTYQDGQEFMKMTVTKVVFNSNLEDSFFQMPK